MGEIVNLNRFRKAKERGEAARQAAENRTRFGASKAERAKRGREAEKERKSLDDKQLD